MTFSTSINGGFNPLLWETEITGSDEQVITVPSAYLGGTAYDLELLHKNGTGLDAHDIYLRVNELTTASNYRCQQANWSDATPTSTRVNLPRIGACEAGQGGGLIYMSARIDAGEIFRARSWTSDQDSVASGLQLGLYNTIYGTATVSSIDNLDVYFTVSDGAGIGTILRLLKPYKL